MSTTTPNPCRVITGVVRLSYVHIWEPNAIEEGETPKYSTAILIPKSDTATLGRIRNAIEAAKQQGKAKWAGKIPPTLKLPLRDGDDEKPDDEAYEGMYFLNASSKEQPGVVDLARNPIIDRGEIYSGVWARVSINFYAFNAKERNKGIAVGLNNLQKIKDDTPLSGGASAEDDFDDGFIYEADPMFD